VQTFEEIKGLFDKYVVPSYSRFSVAFERGCGSRLWDIEGKEYLDFGSGIAVCCLGHAHPEIAETIYEQSKRLIHISNLYYHRWQGMLAERLVGKLGKGKVFFANSGAEANEGLYKLARKFGHDDGRFEILTAENSFHGRTLAGISATGQDKVKKGFEPMVAGFRHVPFNDLAAMENAISPATVAILVEGIQGEGGITPASADYLIGLRKLCNERKLLLLMDEVQCGYYRTGRFASFQRILENIHEATGFLPDGVSMAKSLGGGFPIGAFWVREPYADLLSPGTHASTFGGTPLACAVALKIMEIIERDHLDQNARNLGDWMKQQLIELSNRYPQVINTVRGLGLMIGVVFNEKDKIPALAASQKTVSVEVTSMLQNEGLLVIPSGTQVIRILPPLNLSKEDAIQGLAIIEKVVSRLAQ
jgi:acetylornithine aminotransferase/acetylornithine/N-succinyldiaminopimelate aminotransferase